MNALLAVLVIVVILLVVWVCMAGVYSWMYDGRRSLGKDSAEAIVWAREEMRGPVRKTDELDQVGTGYVTTQRLTKGKK